MATTRPRRSGPRRGAGSSSAAWRTRVSPAELRGLPPKWALVLYHHRKPYALRAPVAARRWRLRRAFLPWPVALPAPVVRLPFGSSMDEVPSGESDRGERAPALRPASDEGRNAGAGDGPPAPVNEEIRSERHER